MEKYLMQVEEMAKAGPLIKGVDIAEVGDSLGYTLQESRDIVDLMANEGWILPFDGTPPRKVRLTLGGKREIARLRKTKFRRWWEDGGKTDIGIVIAVAALICAIIRLCY
jgi:hypothetical protein